MLDEASVERELVVYEQTLMKFADRYALGERSDLTGELQACGDALVCLMEEVPIGRRQKIDDLIDRFEALRRSCLN